MKAARKVQHVAEPATAQALKASLKLSAHDRKLVAAIVQKLEEGAKRHHAAKVAATRAVGKRANGRARAHKTPSYGRARALKTSSY